MLRAREFRVEDHDDALAALAASRSGGTDFPDPRIGETNASAGCESTATFGCKVLSFPRFSAVR
jgi:predicted nucleic-acid-binding protein